MRTPQTHVVLSAPPLPTPQLVPYSVGGDVRTGRQDINVDGVCAATTIMMAHRFLSVFAHLTATITPVDVARTRFLFTAGVTRTRVSATVTGAFITAITATFAATTGRMAAASPGRRARFTATLVSTVRTTLKPGPCTRFDPIRAARDSEQRVKLFFGVVWKRMCDTARGRASSYMNFQLPERC